MLMRKCESLEDSVHLLEKLLLQHGIDLPPPSTTMVWPSSTSCMQQQGNHSFGNVFTSCSLPGKAATRYGSTNDEKNLAVDEQPADDGSPVSWTATSFSTGYCSPADSRLPVKQQYNRTLPCAPEAVNPAVTNMHAVSDGGTVRLSELDPVSIGMEFVLT